MLLLALPTANNAWCHGGHCGSGAGWGVGAGLLGLGLGAAIASGANREPSVVYVEREPQYEEPQELTETDENNYQELSGKVDQLSSEIEKLRKENEALKKGV